MKTCCLVVSFLFALGATVAAQSLLVAPDNPSRDGLSFTMQTLVLTGSPATGASSNRVGLLLQS